MSEGIYPITPYAGSSGHSGSETSRERAEDRDSSGLTAQTQRRLYVMIKNQQEIGMTVAEARNALPSDHHGTISGALSNLHMKGLITRLTEKRGRCQVYVLPEHVEGRETVPQRRNKREVLTEDDQRVLTLAVLALAEDRDPIPVSKAGLRKLLLMIDKLGSFTYVKERRESE